MSGIRGMVVGGHSGRRGGYAEVSLRRRPFRLGQRGGKSEVLRRRLRMRAETCTQKYFSEPQLRVITRLGT